MSRPVSPDLSLVQRVVSPFPRGSWDCAQPLAPHAPEKPWAPQATEKLAVCQALRVHPSGLGRLWQRKHLFGFLFDLLALAFKYSEMLSP